MNSLLFSIIAECHRTESLDCIFVHYETKEIYMAGVLL